MPRPFARDRIEAVAEGKLVLFSPWAKPWVVHRAATLRSAEHPGTAVRWEDALWEVVDAARSREEPGFLYTLAPWNEQHTIRVVADYSEASEAARVVEVADYHRRESTRWVVLLLSPLAGLMPTPHQEHLEREYGVRATVLTAVSLVLPGIYGTVSVLFLLAAGFAPLLKQGVIPVSILPLLLGSYLFSETLTRLAIWGSGRAIGSLLGIPLGWLHSLSRRLRSLPAVRPGMPQVVADIPAEMAADDRFRMLEAVLGLLRAREQELLRDRFGFEPVTWGRRTAVFLLCYPGLTLPAQLVAFVERPLGVAGLLLLMLTAAVVVEQVWRLSVLGSARPAPSFLGALVRPFAAPLLG